MHATPQQLGRRRTAVPASLAATAQTQCHTRPARELQNLAKREACKAVPIHWLFRARSTVVRLGGPSSRILLPLIAEPFSRTVHISAQQTPPTEHRESPATCSNPLAFSPVKQLPALPVLNFEGRGTLSRFLGYGSLPRYYGANFPGTI